MMDEATADQLGALYDRALVKEKQGAREDAARLYRECLVLDPADHCGAAVRLASLGFALLKNEMPQKASDAYVATLFDQHASDFDDILTDDLGYAVPMELASLLTARPDRRFARALDLGCGTGLSGLTLGGICDHIIGVDLSEKMTDEADERAVYDALYVNEAVHFLEEWSKAISASAEISDNAYTPFDLIVATDVFPYIGDLAPFLQAAGLCMAGDGTLAISSETLADEDFLDEQGHNIGWRVTPHQRFAHHQDYLRTSFFACGFQVIEHFDPIIVRYEEGKPLFGHLVVARYAAQQENSAPVKRD